MAYSGEPVSIRVEVRRGKELVMVMGCGMSGPGVWSSPTPDHDIVTQAGPLCEILVLPSLRGREWRMTPEEEKLPMKELDAERLRELEKEIPF